MANEKKLDPARPVFAVVASTGGVRPILTAQDCEDHGFGIVEVPPERLDEARVVLATQHLPPSRLDA